MIKEQDVIRMKIPFPNVASGLAVRSHMYVCMEEGTRKSFAKCQTLKPYHLLSHREPSQYVIEEADLKRNPFIFKTIVDCDKFFGIDNLIVDSVLLTHRRKDVCDDLFRKIIRVSSHPRLARHSFDESDLISLNNNDIRPVS